MKIHDEMSQIPVPEDLDEKTHQSILRAEKTVQKNRFRKKCTWSVLSLSLIHISEPTRRTPISYAVFCLKKKKKKYQ